MQVTRPSATDRALICVEEKSQFRSHTRRNTHIEEGEDAPVRSPQRPSLAAALRRTASLSRRTSSSSSRSFLALARAAVSALDVLESVEMRLDCERNGKEGQ